MAITNFPSSLQHDSLLACAICRVKLSLDKATAGLFNADNRQALACVSHFSEVELLIVGWANFMECERRKFLRRRQEPDRLIYEGWGDARFNP